MTVQASYYQFLVENVFSHGELPEQLRFNRLCRQNGRMLWWIRYELVQHHVTKIKTTYTIIDSLPLPLCHGCHGMHQPWGKALHGVADTITPASVHDIKVLRSLLHQYSCPMS